MVAEGVLENPKPDYILALHLWNEKPLGWLGITPGPAMAGAEVFEIKITGKGGHGASPHRAVDPVLASAHVITALQSITSRNVAPLKSAVVSVTAVRAGEAFNVIPPYAELKGTIRSFEPEVREKVVSLFHQVVSNVSEGLGCETEISVRSITPPVINDPHIAQHVLDTARKVFPDSEIASDSQTMGSEDMAFMMNEIPGCYFFIGSANREAGLDAAHHHPRFDFDERALTRGAALMTAATVDLLD
jgi:amidohydrolase